MEKNLIGITTGWMCYLVTVRSFIFVKSSNVPASFPVNFHLHVSLFINQSLLGRMSSPNLSTLAAKKSIMVLLLLSCVLFCFCFQNTLTR